MKPVISIITVSYNAVSTIEQTILSVINQAYSNIEYIIIDGGSTDGTNEVIEKYLNKISYYISEPDNGIYNAMNKAVDVLTGDFALFLGADDILLHNILEKVSSLLSNATTIYYGNSFFTRDQICYCGRFNTYKICKQNISHQALFYPSNALLKYKYDENYKLLADYNLNLLLWADSEFSFKYMPLTISIFNQYGSCNQGYDHLFMNNKYDIIKDNISGVFSCYFSCIDRVKSFLRIWLRK